MSRKLAFSLALLAGVALPIANAATAAIGLGGAGPQALALVAGPVVKVQFVFDDQNYCWYDDGWQGPGWYWCGYAWDEGVGWGGGYGWNGWRGGLAQRRVAQGLASVAVKSAGSEP